MRFSDTLALNGVTASWGPGVHGLLGPNGAGKSTLFRVLAGAVTPSSGAVTVGGAPLASAGERVAWQRSLGFLPQDPGWPDDLSARELLVYFGILRGLSRTGAGARAAELLGLVNLEAKADAKIRSLSGGQRRRLFIAQAIVHDPSAVLLDEPTAGLDPAQRIAVRELVVALGRTRVVLVSTHMVEDLVRGADDVTVLSGGILRWRGTPADLGTLGEASAGDDRVQSTFERGFLSLVGGDL